MEELRSTEILDREIREDARKKAERLLANSETEIQNISVENQRRINNITLEKTRYYDQRIDSYRRDVEAALPLEKDRYQVLFEDMAVAENIKAYVANLSDEKKLTLIQNLLERYKLVLTGAQVDVFVHGLNVKKLEAYLKKTFGSTFVASIVELTDAEAEQKEGLLGAIIEAVDKSFRCRVTIVQIMQEILDTNRFELANTLFGGRLSH